MLDGIRVIELADELGEFAGKLLAGLGAQVIKVEPPQGAPTRRLGPFFTPVDSDRDGDRDDDGGSDRDGDGESDGDDLSLYFWHYNTNKQSVSIDLESAEGRQQLRSLVLGADVLLESIGHDACERLGLSFEALVAENPALIQVAISPFGREGPMSGWHSSDLVQLALGGVLMTTGYSPETVVGGPNPPIAPQMWHSSHIAGAHATIATLGAVLGAERSGEGQLIDISLHRSIHYDTVADLEAWIFARQSVIRQTAQYAAPVLLRKNLLRTRDGRYLFNYLYQPRHYVALRELLEAEGVPITGLSAEQLDAEAAAVSPRFCSAVEDAAASWVASQDYSDEIWKAAHRYRLNWAPVRSAAEALGDDYWRTRGSLVDIEHEEVGRSFTYVDQPWNASATPWCKGRRAPLLGEDNHLLEEEASRSPEVSGRPHRSGLAGSATQEPAPNVTRPVASLATPEISDRVNSAIGSSLKLPRGARPLAGVRVVDLTWIVAGAGATRLMAALGAEVIKVEWEANLDALRLNGTVIPLTDPGPTDAQGCASSAERIGPEQGAQFAEMNAGKLGISLNIKQEEARKLLLRLVAMSDVVVENLAPGALERTGLSYEVLAQANPGIVFAQLSGFGQTGPYASFISTAPVAEAFSGLMAQSGLPDPMPPAGWGYPYLDIASSYYLTMAILGALRHRRRTGEGQRIDCSLAETGLYLTGTELLDFQANGGVDRTGNTSPALAAGPHGVFPCRGKDRWIAIAVFDELAWNGLLGVLQSPALADDPRFAKMVSRQNNRGVLEALISAVTRSWEPMALCQALQAAGVAAGVCQTTADRMRDPQLQFDQAMVNLSNPVVGSWPVRQVPWRSSGAATGMGGARGRGFPCYAEDNAYVYESLLGLRPAELEKLAEEKVI